MSWHAAMRWVASPGNTYVTMGLPGTQANVRGWCSRPHDVEQSSPARFARWDYPNRSRKAGGPPPRLRQLAQRHLLVRPRTACANGSKRARTPRSKPVKIWEGTYYCRARAARGSPGALARTVPSPPSPRPAPLPPGSADRHQFRPTSRVGAGPSLLPRGPRGPPSSSALSGSLLAMHSAGHALPPPLLLLGCEPAVWRHDRGPEA